MDSDVKWNGEDNFKEYVTRKEFEISSNQTSSLFVMIEKSLLQIQKDIKEINKKSETFDREFLDKMHQHEIEIIKLKTKQSDPSLSMVNEDLKNISNELVKIREDFQKKIYDLDKNVEVYNLKQDKEFAHEKGKLHVWYMLGGLIVGSMITGLIQTFVKKI